jgi:hypothetical protein
MKRHYAYRVVGTPIVGTVFAHHKRHARDLAQRQHGAQAVVVWDNVGTRTQPIRHARGRWVGTRALRGALRSPCQNPNHQ